MKFHTLLQTIQSGLIMLIGISLVGCTQGIIPETTSNTTPTTTMVTYASQIAPLVATSCISCHSTSNMQGGLLLETYTQVRNATENGNLIQRINDPANPMPTTGLLPAQQRALFDAWVTNNYQEN